MSFFGFGSKFDKIYMEGSSEPFATYPKGTIEGLESKNGYTSFHIKNEKYANDLFQQLIRRTDVEWVNAKFEKGRNGFNFLINSHHDRESQWDESIIKEQIDNGYLLKSHKHSHPIPIEIKKRGSNLDYNLDISDEDKKLARKYPNATFEIHNLKDNKIYLYDENGIYKTK